MALLLEPAGPARTDSRDTLGHMPMASHDHRATIRFTAAIEI
jgi:hypothetical protein